jgi:uncharacterized protein (TIGR03032 family)
VTSDGTVPSASPRLDLLASRQFPSWLAEHGSVAFTTYQAGKLFLVGTGGEKSLSVFERTFPRCMGLCVSGNTMWMSSLVQLWRFENAVPTGSTHDDYDAVFVPQVGYTTGDIDVHDIAVEQGQEPLFVNTLFGCLARPSSTHSFRAVWWPPFVSKLAPEDRCHLNGLAVRDGRAAFVTVVSRSDVADGWRDRRLGGGCILAVESGEPVVEGLTMPHSPRWYRDRLWVLDSGTGMFGFVDTVRGVFEGICFVPGFARGLAFTGDFAVVGLSTLRAGSSFGDLPLLRTLADRDTDPRCGLYVIDLRTGDAVHWLRVSGAVSELYDVALLPGIRRPMALGFLTDEIRRMLTIEPGE